jgi:hypothetical protein
LGHKTKPIAPWSRFYCTMIRWGWSRCMGSPSAFVPQWSELEQFSWCLFKSKTRFDKHHLVIQAWTWILWIAAGFLLIVF